MPSEAASHRHGEQWTDPVLQLRCPAAGLAGSDRDDLVTQRQHLSSEPFDLTHPGIDGEATRVRQTR